MSADFQNYYFTGVISVKFATKPMPYFATRLTSVTTRSQGLK